MARACIFNGGIMSGTPSPHPPSFGPRDALALKAGVLISVAILSGYCWGYGHTNIYKGTLIPAVVGIIALAVAAVRLILIWKAKEPAQHLLSVILTIILAYCFLLLFSDSFLLMELSVTFNFGMTIPLIMGTAFFVYRHDAAATIGLLVFVTVCFFLLGYNVGHYPWSGVGYFTYMRGR